MKKGSPNKRKRIRKADDSSSFSGQEETPPTTPRKSSGKKPSPNNTNEAPNRRLSLRSSQQKSPTKDAVSVDVITREGENIDAVGSENKENEMELSLVGEENSAAKQRAVIDVDVLNEPELLMTGKKDARPIEVDSDEKIEEEVEGMDVEGAVDAKAKNEHSETATNAVSAKNEPPTTLPSQLKEETEIEVPGSSSPSPLPVTPKVTAKSEARDVLQSEEIEAEGSELVPAIHMEESPSEGDDEELEVTLRAKDKKPPSKRGRKKKPTAPRQTKKHSPAKIADDKPPKKATPPAPQSVVPQAKPSEEVMAVEKQRTPSKARTKKKKKSSEEYYDDSAHDIDLPEPSASDEEIDHSGQKGSIFEMTQFETRTRGQEMKRILEGPKPKKGARTLAKERKAQVEAVAFENAEVTTKTPAKQHRQTPPPKPRKAATLPEPVSSESEDEEFQPTPPPKKSTNKAKKPAKRARKNSRGAATNSAVSIQISDDEAKERVEPIEVESSTDDELETQSPAQQQPIPSSNNNSISSTNTSAATIQLDVAVPDAPLPSRTPLISTNNNSISTTNNNSFSTNNDSISTFTSAAMEQPSSFLQLIGVSLPEAPHLPQPSRDVKRAISPQGASIKPDPIDTSAANEVPQSQPAALGDSPVDAQFPAQQPQPSRPPSSSPPPPQFAVQSVPSVSQGPIQPFTGPLVKPMPLPSRPIQSVTGPFVQSMPLPSLNPFLPAPAPDYLMQQQSYQQFCLEQQLQSQQHQPFPPIQAPSQENQQVGPLPQMQQQSQYQQRLGQFGDQPPQQSQVQQYHTALDFIASLPPSKQLQLAQMADANFTLSPEPISPAMSHGVTPQQQQALENYYPAINLVNQTPEDKQLMFGEMMKNQQKEGRNGYDVQGNRNGTARQQVTFHNYNGPFLPSPVDVRKLAAANVQEKKEKKERLKKLPDEAKQKSKPPPKRAKQNDTPEVMNIEASNNNHSNPVRTDANGYPLIAPKQFVDPMTLITPLPHPNNNNNNSNALPPFGMPLVNSTPANRPRRNVGPVDYTATKTDSAYTRPAHTPLAQSFGQDFNNAPPPFVQEQPVYAPLALTRTRRASSGKRNFDSDFRTEFDEQEEEDEEQRRREAEDDELQLQGMIGRRATRSRKKTIDLSGDHKPDTIDLTREDDDLAFPFDFDIYGIQMGSAALKCTKVTFREKEFEFACPKSETVIVPYATIKLVSVGVKGLYFCFNLNAEPVNESLKTHTSFDVASDKIDGRIALVLNSVQQGEKLIQLFTSATSTILIATVNGMKIDEYLIKEYCDLFTNAGGTARTRTMPTRRTPNLSTSGAGKNGSKVHGRAYHEDRILVYPQHAKDAVTLHYTDLARLEEGQKLNDNIIDFYLRYLFVNPATLSSGDTSKIYIFGSYFYKALVTNNKAKLRKWTKGLDVFSYDFLLVPINMNDHWKLAIICFSRFVVNGEKCTLETQPVILILDSMGTQNKSETTLCNRLRRYLNEEWAEKTKEPKHPTLNFDKMKLLCPKVPEQPNIIDCGVYLLKFAHEFCALPPKTFDKSGIDATIHPDWFDSDKEIPKLRIRLKEIVTYQAQLQDLENNPPLIDLDSSTSEAEAEQDAMEGETDEMGFDEPPKVDDELEIHSENELLVDAGSDIGTDPGMQVEHAISNNANNSHSVNDNNSRAESNSNNSSACDMVTSDVSQDANASTTAAPVPLHSPETKMDIDYSSPPLSQLPIEAPPVKATTGSAVGVASGPVPLSSEEDDVRAVELGL